MPSVSSPYIGRFAPSPSGPLHDGSLVAAMASFLDARAHNGSWLLRIEDIDTPRVAPGADRTILHQLQSLGMHWDGDPVWQSMRVDRYQAAFDALQRDGLIYGCCCTRQALAGVPVYPGTCRRGLPPGQKARSWRVRMPSGTMRFVDRWQGPQEQDLEKQVGDFVVKRADGLWAYQLAVVVDDAEQGVTDVVRGVDLLDSTARQLQLAAYLGYPPARFMHTPLLMDENGRKLSKQNHAPALDQARPLSTLARAWQVLGYAPIPARDVDSFWRQAVQRWASIQGLAFAIQ
jgi:glutamyl-Q tRNA(Asp) synthetase